MKRFGSLGLACLAAASLAAACPPTPNPNPPGPTGGAPPNPPPVAGAAGQGGQGLLGLEERACTTAWALCAVDYGECVRQVAQLRNASYAKLSDADLQCWIDAPDRAALSKCPNGVCK